MKKLTVLYLAVFVLGCTNNSKINPKKTNVPKPEQIKKIVCRAADWQLAHPIIMKPRPILVGDWAYGPFLNGLFAIGQMPGNEKYISELMRIGKEQNWQLISSVCPANDHATPQSYLEMYEMLGDESMLTPTRKALDAYMEVSDKQDASVDFVKKNFTKWSWCDALYMSPPTFARLAKVTGDKKYLDYLHKWWWRVSDYYYDPEEHLYFRDQNFFGKREANGEKVFWSRGNGWVVGGLVRVLQYLPEDDPFRPRYEQQLKEMCTKLASIQRPDGLWSSGLLDPSHQAETSGSSFILYGLAYAMNENLIDRDQYMPVVLKAWWSLCGYVKEDGKFTGVQPIADSPGKYDESYTMPYGVGAFLLAGSEMYKLVDSI